MPQSDTETLIKTDVRKPSLFQVVLLNDDFTPMDFVVQILQAIFHKSNSEATEIMLTIHNSGQGICGVYSYEVAEAKVLQVSDMAAKQEYPLQCKIERS